MPTTVAMPRLSDSMEEGTIVRWLVDDGEEVARGTEIAEIETDKATMAFEVDGAGRLHRLALEGETLAVGEPIAELLAEGEEPTEREGGGGEGDAGAQTAGDGAEGAEGGAAGAADAGDGADAAGDGREGAAAASAMARAEGDGVDDGDGRERATAAAGARSAVGERVKASPLARRVARELGVELAEIDGTGPNGRIVKADVEAAAERGTGAAAPAAGSAAERPAPAPAPADGTEGAKGTLEVVEPTRIQQVIARRMSESKATIPDFQVTTEADVTELLELRRTLKQHDRNASVNDFVVKACGLALREHPKANGAFADGKFQLHGRVNIGIAVAGEGTLVVPTIFDADRKPVTEIASETRALAGRVRDGAITPPELAGGTFTVSNLGMYGITSFTAVINPGQAAILAVGAAVKRPVYGDDGEAVPRSLMALTLSCDHRILYGADAAEFLARVRELLETPYALIS